MVTEVRNKVEPHIKYDVQELIMNIKYNVFDDVNDCVIQDKLVDTHVNTNHVFFCTWCLSF